MIFPIEVWYNISLYLKPQSLSLNKILSSLYNEFYYKKYLQNKYPELELWAPFGYKELYKKSLLQGKIQIRNEFLSETNGRNNNHFCEIEGIKCSRYGFCELVLTFNGDLYYCSSIGINNIKSLKCIDNHVIDIAYYGYIKENYVYYLNYSSLHHFLPPTFSLTNLYDNLQSIQDIDIISKKALYYFKFDSANKDHPVYSGKYIFEDEIVKIITHFNYKLCLLKSDKLIVLTSSNRIVGSIDDISELYYHFLKTKDNIYYRYGVYTIEPSKNNYQENLFSEIPLQGNYIIRSHIISSDYFDSLSDYDYVYAILTDEYIYKYDNHWTLLTISKK